MTLLRKSRTALRIVRTKLRQYLLPRQPWQGRGTPRVLFVSDTAGATYHYRVQNQVEQILIAGFSAAICHPQYLGAANLVRGCDLLMLYRPDDTPQLRQIVARARARGIPVIYDTDDLTWDERLIEYAALERYHGPASLPRFRSRMQRERAVLGLADACITSTEYLADLVRAAAGFPVFVNQNAIDEHSVRQTELLLRKRGPRKAAGNLAISYFSGWAQAHEIDLAVATNPIQRVLTDLPHARLRLVGHFDMAWLPPELQSQVELAPFVPYEQLFAAIATADINIAPLVANPHRRSKSAIKYLEAALVGVPTVASDLEPYRMIQHGQTGYLAADADGWYASIMGLASDPQLRLRIGRAARAHVLADHTTAVRAAGYAAILRAIVK